MKRLLPILLAAPVAAFFVPVASAQFCNTWGVCVQMNPGDNCFGTVVPVCPTPTPTPPPPPTPTPLPREGEIMWRPTNTVTPATYVQGPWAMLASDGTLYVGAHVGHCCPGIDDPAGWEAPFVIRWTPDAVDAAFPVIRGLSGAASALPPEPWYDYDTHEFAWGSMVRGHGPTQLDTWIYASLRSTKSSWVKLLETGVGNRTRGNISFFSDPMGLDWFTFWDLIPTCNLECNERNTPGCGGADVPGVMMPILVWIDDLIVGGVSYGENLVLYVQDPDGLVAWIVSSGGTPAPGTVYGYYAGAMGWFGPIPGSPAYSDMAMGDDGLLYALVSARDGKRPGEEPCWWWNCRAIDEHVSHDYGRTWQRGDRSWSTVARDLVNDGAYVRDERGHVKRAALTVVALAMDSSDPTGSGKYRLHWWTDAGFPLPASWGHEPGWQFPRIRQHLERRK
jgi:hypothetical protein